MKNIAFYISNHGFGHASRNIPLIRYILEHDNKIKIFIKTGKEQGEFIKNSIDEFNDRVEYHFEKVDLGLVLKNNSLKINKKLLEEKVREYLDSWSEIEKREMVFLRTKNIELVITDIVPWILNVSKKSNIKSILITNFTWVDIYKEHLDKELVDKIRETYKKATKVYIYDLEIDSIYEYIRSYVKVGITCREFDEEKILEIKKKYKRKLVFVTVGRSVNLKKQINVNKLDYHFIVTEGINLIGDNVTYLDRKIDNTHDYIKASDFIITKAGWGTLAEVLLANKKMAILGRDEVAEDREVIKKLVANNLALKINDDFDLENVLKDLESFSENKNMKFKNDYQNIGNRLIKEIYEV